jgi:hypothetical protein
MALKLFSLVLCCVAITAQAQQGGRFGLLMGVNKVSMVNTDDDKVSTDILVKAPTFGFAKGIEAAYHWRWFGLGAQLTHAQTGQKYSYYGQTQETRLRYYKPTLLLHFNTNPKKDIRLSGFVGGAYGILNKYHEISQITNPVNGAITYTTFTNKEFSITDTGTITGTLSNGIYYNTDASFVAGLGVDFRLSTTWLFGIHYRMDMGMEKLENYDKIKQKYSINNVNYSYDYEHWKYRPSKYDYQPLYTGVRPASTNMAHGIYFSLKYLLLSEAVKEYERYGY